jgi:anti-sigma factor RsiW
MATELSGGGGSWDGHPDDGIGPCPQMHSLLSALSDGTLNGIARWYAERHTLRCAHCAAALASLVVLEARLRALGLPDAGQEAVPPTLRLTPERRAFVEDAWARLDGGGGGD